MAKLGETRLPGDGRIALPALAIVGDDVLAYHTLNRAQPVRTSLWDLATFSLVDLGTGVASWGTGGGTVLRLVDRGNTSCVDVVPMGDLSDAVPSGTCSTFLDRAAGALSPDGRQVAITSDGEHYLLVTAADLHAGVWRPTPLTGAKTFIRWDTASTFLAYSDGDPPTVLRCTGPATCEKIGLPAGDPWIAFLPDPS
jgi:hypothetical protein